MMYSFLAVGGKLLHSMVLVSAIQQYNSAITACMCVCVSHSVMSNSLRPPWTAARQAPLSMGFSRQEYWSGLPFLLPGDLPHPGIKPTSPASAGGFFTTEPLGEAPLFSGLLFWILDF